MLGGDNALAHTCHKGHCVGDWSLMASGDALFYVTVWSVTAPLVFVNDTQNSLCVHPSSAGIASFSFEDIFGRAA